MYVTFYAKKNLKNMPRYTDLSQADSILPHWVQGLKLQENEKLLGIYENSPGKLDDCLVLTNIGIHVYKLDYFDFFRYDQIAETSFPRSKPKKEFSELFLHLSDGRKIELPIRGRTEREGHIFLDIFSLSHFLARVVGTNKHKNFYR